MRIRTGEDSYTRSDIVSRRRERKTENGKPSTVNRGASLQAGHIDGPCYNTDVADAFGNSPDAR